MLQLRNYHPLHRNTEPLKNITQQIVRQRPFLRRIAQEISNHRRHISFHLNNENLLVIPQKNRRTAIGGKNPTNLYQNDIRVHGPNLRRASPIDKPLPSAAGFGPWIFVKKYWTP